MLHNYGGRRGLYGNLAEIGSQPLTDFAKADGTMVRGAGWKEVGRSSLLHTLASGLVSYV